MCKKNARSLAIKTKNQAPSLNSSRTAGHIDRQIL